MRPHVRLAAVVALVVLSAGCGTSPSESDPPTGASPASTPAASGSVTPMPSTSDGVPSVGPSVPGDLREQPRVVAAIDDTAAREGVTADQVVIAAWTPVTWNDGSLGCPEKGMSYTQATVDGELLILRADSGLFQYHARTGGPFTYCASPSAGYTVGG